MREAGSISSARCRPSASASSRKMMYLSQSVTIFHRRNEQGHARHVDQSCLQQKECIVFPVHTSQTPAAIALLGLPPHMTSGFAPALTTTLRVIARLPLTQVLQLLKSKRGATAHQVLFNEDGASPQRFNNDVRAALEPGRFVHHAPQSCVRRYTCGAAWADQQVAGLAACTVFHY